MIHRVGLACCLLLTGTIGLQRAKAVGDTRTITLHHVHTNEELTITYKKNGQYDQDALKQINWILRDWRKNEATTMDPQEIDLLWEVYQDVGGKEPIYIVCGYRAPSTNEMLRHRSRKSGVARFSQHTLGKAIDFYIPGVPLETLRAAAMKLQGGGVGYYPTSGSPFVHLDVGNVRAWPRMTREQLAKLFPDGRTVHLPPDGTPLPGYQLALADIEARHGAAPSLPKAKSLFAKLFGGADKDAEEAEDNDQAGDTSASSRSVTAAVAAPIQVASADNSPAQTLRAVRAVPLPRHRPAFLTTADKPATAALAAAPIILASLSPIDIIKARGLWDDPSDATAMAATAPDVGGGSGARQKLAASMVALTARRDVTASISPFTGPDRNPQIGALAYADPGLQLGATTATKGSSSIVSKAIDTASSHPSAERLSNPWMRSVMLATTMRNSLVVTPIGDPDYAGLVTYMRKPSFALLMTFSADPHAGLSAEQFSGSAVVFPPTVTFELSRRTAHLQ